MQACRVYVGIFDLRFHGLDIVDLGVIQGLGVSTGLMPYMGLRVSGLRVDLFCLLSPQSLGGQNL